MNTRRVQLTPLIQQFGEGSRVKIDYVDRDFTFERSG